MTLAAPPEPPADNDNSLMGRVESAKRKLDATTGVETLIKRCAEELGFPKGTAIHESARVIIRGYMATILVFMDYEEKDRQLLLRAFDQLAKT
jgi:hypothetical protein